MRAGHLSRVESHPLVSLQETATQDERSPLRRASNSCRTPTVITGQGIEHMPEMAHLFMKERG